MSIFLYINKEHGADGRCVIVRAMPVWRDRPELAE